MRIWREHKHFQYKKLAPAPRVGAHESVKTPANGVFTLEARYTITMDSSLKTAIKATLHCLTGCAAGETFGMVVSTALNWNNFVTVTVSILLSFIFGYALSLRPILKAAVPFKKAARIAFASDTVSITSMEIVDNTLELIIPGALAASLSTFLFWWSLALSLVVAFIVTVPVNYWLISHGRGHALVHESHHHM